MIKRYLTLYSFTLICLCSGIALKAQTMTGEIQYDRTTYWTRMMDYLPFLSKAEKERTMLTWGKDDGYTSQYVLNFDSISSLYAYAEMQKEKDGGWSWRQEELFLYRNLETNQSRDIIEMPDRIYLVEDELPTYKWKILSEIKDIQGHICMSAETRDTIKTQRIVAWFTTEIPLPFGPEGYGGLPGMILELDINDGAVLVSATGINHNPPEKIIALPKRKKIKQITAAQYQTKLQKYISESMEGKRNPYWNIRD